jgi:hypothetical protein
MFVEFPEHIDSESGLLVTEGTGVVKSWMVSEPLQLFEFVTVTL